MSIAYNPCNRYNLETNRNANEHMNKNEFGSRNMRPFVILLIYDNLIITITIMTVGDFNGHKTDNDDYA